MLAAYEDQDRPPDRALDTVRYQPCLTLRYMYPIRQKSNTCSVGVELKGQHAGWRPPRSLPSSSLRTWTPAAPDVPRLRVRVVSIAVALRRDRSKRPEVLLWPPGGAESFVRRRPAQWWSPQPQRPTNSPLPQASSNPNRESARLWIRCSALRRSAK